MKDSQGADRLVDVNDRPYTALCDWLETCKATDMTCATSVDSAEMSLDSSTYSAFHASYMEAQIKKHIRFLFSKQAVYHETEFVNVMEAGTNFSKMAISIVLRNTIGDRTFVVRHDGQEGFVIYRNSYYIFQPFIYAMLDIPIAIRSAHVPVKRDAFTPMRVEREVAGPRTKLDWGVISTWIELLEAGEIESEEPDGEIVDMIDVYVTDPVSKLKDASRYTTLFDKLKMVMKFMNDVPEEYKSSAGAVCRAYFWDTWLTTAEQEEILEGGADENSGTHHRTAIEDIRALRFLNPYSGVMEYKCGDKKCSDALTGIFEKNPADNVRIGSIGAAVVGKTGPVYGFITYKTGIYKFKMAEPVKEGQPTPHGLVCETVSRSTIIDDALRTIDEPTQNALNIDFNYVGLLKTKKYDNNSQLCTLLELQLRLMDIERVEGKRWFYRPIEAHYSGHKGEGMKKEVAQKEEKKAAQIKGMAVPFQRTKMPGYGEKVGRPVENAETGEIQPKKRTVRVKPKMVETIPEEEETVERVVQAPQMYFEHQESEYCARHAMNNMLGSAVFSDAALQALCRTLPQPTEHCSTSGFYSSTLVLAALEGKNYGTQIITAFDDTPQYRVINKEKETAETIQRFDRTLYETPYDVTLKMVLETGLTLDNFIGVLIVNGVHWISIKKDSDGYWWLDSLFEKPSRVRDFKTDITALVEKAKAFNNRDLYAGNVMIGVYRGAAHNFYPNVGILQPKTKVGTRTVKKKPAQIVESTIGVVAPAEAAVTAMSSAKPKRVMPSKIVGVALSPEKVMEDMRNVNVKMPPPLPNVVGTPIEPDQVLKNVSSKHTPIVQEEESMKTPVVEEEEEESMKTPVVAEEETAEESMATPVVTNTKTNTMKTPIVNEDGDVEETQEEEEEDDNIGYLI